MCVFFYNCYYFFITQPDPCINVCMCMCVCVRVCTHARVCLCFFWLSIGKAAFFPRWRGRFIRSAGSGSQPATQAQREPPLGTHSPPEDRRGCPCQAWRPNNCLIRTFSERHGHLATCSSASSSQSLLPLRTFSTFCFFIIFSTCFPFFPFLAPQVTHYAGLLGIVLLDLVPL